MTELFQKLRDKHLFRTAFIYLGVAWASMEAIGFFVDNYGWSRTVLDVAVLLVVLGFPAALIIAWYHGERGKQAVQRTEASLLLTLAVLAAIGTFRLTTAEEIASPFRDTARAPFTTASNPDLGERSVAVLPFVNSTGVDSLDWLGPGMSDMLTTNLAQAGGLRVVSPQRLFELLRDTGHEETASIPQELAMDVASQSGARTMVYGSILGTAQDMALDAQLIDLADGTIIAAERARGSDVFALADTVADRLARQLGERARDRGMTLVDATLPPEKPPLALTGDVGKLREFQVSLRQAWETLESESDSVEVHYRIADMLEDVPGREAETRRALEEIVTITPEDARAVGRLAHIAITQGDTAAADSLIARFTVVEKDQLRAMAGSGRLLEHAGRAPEARQAYRHALELKPGSTVVLNQLARTFLRDNDPEGARTELERFLASPDPAVSGTALLLTGDAYAWEGRFDEAIRIYGEAEALGDAESRPDIRAQGLESALYVQWVLDPTDGFSRLNSSIWTLIDLGKAEKAVNLVQAAERLYVKDADRLFPVEYHTLLYAKGRVYELVGADRAAVDAYSQLMRHWGHVISRLPLMADTPERLAALRGRKRPAGTPASGERPGVESSER
jgi:serine/threonine-protein kinase